MSFGLTSAQAVFIALMNQVYEIYIDKFMIVFIDDILMYSEYQEEHKHHLRLVLKRLKEKQLYSKLLQIQAMLIHDGQSHLSRPYSF